MPVKPTSELTIRGGRVVHVVEAGAITLMVDVERAVAEGMNRDEVAKLVAKRAPKTQAKGHASESTGDPKTDNDPKAEREYEMGIVLGPPAFGKTSFVDMLARYYASQGGKVFVVDPNDAWRGVPYVTPVWVPKSLPRGERKSALDDIIASFEESGPAMLVLDDADKYSRRATEVIEDLMTSFRHWEKDVVVVSRRPQGMSKDAIANASWFAFFSCREVYARRYVAELFGPGNPIIREIPDEPHAFLYVRNDADKTRALYQTEPRAVVTKSTRRTV